MVTSDEDLTALVKRNSNKWDLRSMDKRDAWMLRADEKFSSDPEAYYAITNGPVTLEKVRAKDPSLSLKEAKKIVAMLSSTYDEANARGYGLLLPMIDLEQRPALASQILQKIKPTRDGNALWVIVQEVCDTSSLGKQEELERQYGELELSKSSNPQPAELEEGLAKLEVLWLQIEGNSADKPQKLIQRALKLLPSKSAAMANFSGMMRVLVSTNKKTALFDTFEDFKKELVEQYRLVYNAKAAEEAMAAC